MSPRPKPKMISFDVFGTLVDWRAGLDAALAEHAGLTSEAQRARLVAEREDAEWELLEELEDFVPYRRLLADSLLVAARRSGTLLGASAAERVAATIGAWPLFGDVSPALGQLAARFELALVSNVDPEDLERVIARLDAPITHVVTSSAVEAYKPEPDALMALLHERALDEEELLHVSAHADYDLQTAMDLGVPAAYLDRRGEALDEELEVALKVRDMPALVRALVPGRRGPAGGRRRGGRGGRGGPSGG